MTSFWVKKSIENNLTRGRNNEVNRFKQVICFFRKSLHIDKIVIDIFRINEQKGGNEREIKKKYISWLHIE